MFELATDVNIGFFAILNQYPLGLTLFLHTVIVLPMFWIYKQEKKRLEDEAGE
jgi:nicotinamide riboside transporter PnuC